MIRWHALYGGHFHLYRYERAELLDLRIEGGEELAGGGRSCRESSDDYVIYESGRRSFSAPTRGCYPSPDHPLDGLGHGQSVLFTHQSQQCNMRHHTWLFKLGAVQLY